MTKAKSGSPPGGISSGTSKGDDGPRQHPPPSALGGCPVCIHCGKRAAEGLYKEYSRDNIRLTRCAHCGAVADPLVEHELLLVLLDLALHKREAYRHLLLNRATHAGMGWAGLLRVALVLAVLDTHSRYAVYAHHHPSQQQQQQEEEEAWGEQVGVLLRLLGLTLVEHAAFAGLVVGAAVALHRRQRRRRQQQHQHQHQHQQQRGTTDERLLLARKLLQALLYPAFARLLVPFIMIWDPAVAVAGVIGALVLSSQWVALHAVLASAPFAFASDSPNDAKGGSSSGLALPFLLGLGGRALLRYFLGGPVISLEGFGVTKIESL